MRIGILGSGLMGGKLGTIFARAGHDVVFSYARSEKKLRALAQDAERVEQRVLGRPRGAARLRDRSDGVEVHGHDLVLSPCPTQDSIVELGCACATRSGMTFVSCDGSQRI